MKVTINNQALAQTLGVKAGGVVDVRCKNGVPVEREWRNRFRDSRIDGCIAIDEGRKSKSKKEAE